MSELPAASSSSPYTPSAPNRRRSVELGLLLATVLVVVVAGLLDSGHSYWHTPASSAHDILRKTVLLGIFAMGSAVVIIAGGIDLSSGSMIAFGGSTFAAVAMLLSPEHDTHHIAGSHIAIATGATLLLGFLVGSLHAWLITGVGLPPFVATLATLVGLRSLARAMVEAVNRAAWGSSSTLINVPDQSFRDVVNSLWTQVGVFLTLAAGFWLLMSRTVTGRRLFALGGNETATRLSGIRTERLKWLAYCLSAMCSALAGIMYVAQESGADPQSMGNGYELNAIAASVVGGCSLQGGIGTISGVALGCLFLNTVINAVGRVIKSNSNLYEGLIVGIVVVVAVAFSQADRRKQFFAGALGWCAIVTLSLFAGALLTLWVGRGAGIGGGVLALVLLAAVKIWEGRKAYS